MIKNTKKITEGAMIVALLGVLFIIDRQSAGIFNYIVAWVVPLPFVVYTAKYGIKDALVPFSASVFVSIILATPVLSIYTVMYGIIGIIYGFGVHKKWQSRHLFFATIVGVSVIYFVSVVLFSVFFGFNIQQDMQSIYQMLETIDTPAGLDVQRVVTSSVVIMYATSVIVETYLIHMLSRVLLHRMKIPIKPSKKLETVQIPKIFGWVMLLGLFVYPIAKVLEANDFILTVGFTIYSWIMILLVYQAFVFVIIVQRRFGLKYLLFMIILGLILIPTLFIDLLMIVGLLDILSDIRSRIIGVNNHA